jgi:two-component system response regulator VicR
VAALLIVKGMDAVVKIKYTILVVDDDEDLLVLMQHSLIQEGYDPIFAPNAKAVMEIISQRAPDLVLLDINMNGVNGADICKQIKSGPITSRIPVVMFSANKKIETIMKECGADAFLRKPFETGKLKIVLDNLLRQESHTEV